MVGQAILYPELPMTVNPDHLQRPAGPAEFEWLAQIRASDPVAFEAMFRAYARRLCGFVYGYVRSRDEAQELVQDLFLWIWEHRHEWEVPGSLKTYLFKSARNRAISLLRHREVELHFQQARAGDVGPATSSSGAPPADAMIDARELAGAIEQAVAGLPPRCREVFILKRRQGLSYADIAAILQISPKTVEIHMGRALTTLRKSLEGWTS